MKIKILFFIGFLIFCFSNCAENGEELSEVTSEKSAGIIPDKVDFNFHVKPILSDRCFKCHGPDKNKVEGGLTLHTQEGAFKALGEKADHHAIVEGDIINSTLIQRITSDDPEQLMPPPES